MAPILKILNASCIEKKLNVGQFKKKFGCSAMPKSGHPISGKRWNLNSSLSRALLKFWCFDDELDASQLSEIRTSLDFRCSLNSIISK